MRLLVSVHNPVLPVNPHLARMCVSTLGCAYGISHFLSFSSFIQNKCKKFLIYCYLNPAPQALFWETHTQCPSSAPHPMPPQPSAVYL